MRAAFIEKPLSMDYCDQPEPLIVKPDDVKIRVAVTGICGSEVHAFHGKHPFRIPPMVSGHEFAGVVTEIGDAVSSVSVGARVTAEPHYGCGHCELCQNGFYNICPDKKVLGGMGWSGSFGEYIVVPERCVVPLQEGVSFEDGALIEPLAVGMHAVRGTNLGIGQTALVIGAGPIGLGVFLCANLTGASKIIVADVADNNLALAAKLGCCYIVNSAKENLRERVMELTGGKGVDVTYMAFGSEDTFASALECTARRGVISEIAITSGKTPLELGYLQQRELTLLGSNMYVKEDFHCVCQAIANGQLKTQGIVTHILPIEECTRAMEIVDKRLDNVIKLLMRF